MKIVVAPDSFKGSLSAIQVADVMRSAILELDPNDTVIVKPMADGGEGTLDSLVEASNSVKVPLNCTGPLGEKKETYYGIINSDTAVIESAAIAGLVHVPEEKRNPDGTTSYGIGEAMLHAIDQGCTSFIIGLGGSATNDGGLGMLQALGMKAWDEKGESVGIYGKDVLKIEEVSFAELDPRLKQIHIKIACDVDNPLFGKRGASHVYGPQKGATEAQIMQYDKALERYSKLVEMNLGETYCDKKGAGAAGGLGFAFMVIKGEIISGAKLIAEAVRLEEAIATSDLIFTGEGQSDEQTLYGKAPGYVATLAKQYDVPVILLSGSLTGDFSVLRNYFAGCFSILNEPLPLETCMEKADSLLSEQTKQVMHLIKTLA